jgi:hypothetical protein
LVFSPPTSLTMLHFEVKIRNPTNKISVAITEVNGLSQGCKSRLQRVSKKYDEAEV